MTSSNGSIFRVTGPLCGEFTGEFSQRPVTRSLDVFFDLRLNKRLSKQSRPRWFETPSLSLWYHCNGARGFKWVLWSTICYRQWCRYRSVILKRFIITDDITLGDHYVLCQWNKRRSYTIMSSVQQALEKTIVTGDLKHYGVRATIMITFHVTLAIQTIFKPDLVDLHFNLIDHVRHPLGRNVWYCPSPGQCMWSLRGINWIDIRPARGIEPQRIYLPFPTHPMV